MGRRRTTHHDLPPQMHRKGKAYYYGRTWIPLGSDYAIALRKYAELHGTLASPGPSTFSDAANSYLLNEMHKLAPATQRGYDRQLKLLVKVFGRVTLEKISPMHVAQYMEKHPAKISATREKALLSSVFTHARRVGLTDAPNPCAGIRGKKAHRRRYVTDAELGAVLPHADQPTRDFLDLLYRTGGDASVVLRLTRQDVQNGALCVGRTKTGEKVRVAIAGPLVALLERLTSYPVASLYLIRDARGQPFRLQAIRRHFWAARAAAGADWQLRDLRPKAGTDLEDNVAANRLLGHAAMSTTDGYIRRAAGRKANPPMREIAEVAKKLQKKDAPKS
jgi:integrase